MTGNFNSLAASLAASSATRSETLCLLLLDGFTCARNP